MADPMEELITILVELEVDSVIDRTLAHRIRELADRHAEVVSWRMVQMSKQYPDLFQRMQEVSSDALAERV